MPHRPSQVDTKVLKESEGHCFPAWLSPRHKGAHLKEVCDCVFRLTMWTQKSLEEAHENLKVPYVWKYLWTKNDRDSPKCKEPSMCQKPIKLQTWPFLTEKEEWFRVQNQNPSAWSWEWGISCLVKRTGSGLTKSDLQAEATNKPGAPNDKTHWPPGAIDWPFQRLSPWNLEVLFQDFHGACRKGTSHRHRCKAKHLNYVLVLALKMTSVWANLFLHIFYYHLLSMF